MAGKWNEDLPDRHSETFDPYAVVSVDIFDSAVHVVRPPPNDVVHGPLWNRCHTVAAVVDDRWRADAGQRPRLRRLRVSEDVDEDGDNRLVGEPSGIVAAAETSPVDFGWDRYRLMMIFSKNHLLPKFCIVCLKLHIYRYLGLKEKRKKRKENKQIARQITDGRL